MHTVEVLNMFDGDDGVHTMEGLNISYVDGVHTV
jgi:hypothetical protein